jgi:hypothetical protein
LKRLFLSGTYMSRWSRKGKGGNSVGFWGTFYMCLGVRGLLLVVVVAISISACVFPFLDQLANLHEI